MNQASQDCKKLKDTIFYKIIRIICTLILVNSCVYMRVCKYGGDKGCDITRIWLCVVRRAF